MIYRVWARFVYDASLWRVTKRLALRQGAGTAARLDVAVPYFTAGHHLSFRRGDRVLVAMTERHAACGSVDPYEIERLQRDGGVIFKTWPALHAKVFVCDSRAVVGSANATAAARGWKRGRREAGLILRSADMVVPVQRWFNARWAEASAVGSMALARCKLVYCPPLPNGAAVTQARSHGSRRRKSQPLERARYQRFNTNEHNRESESYMLQKGVVAAWGRWSRHVRELKQGDRVLLFTNGRGFVGAGWASGRIDPIKRGLEMPLLRFLRFARPIPPARAIKLLGYSAKYTFRGTRHTMIGADRLWDHALRLDSAWMVPAFATTAGA